MPSPFSRTIRSLSGERAIPGVVWLGLSLALLGGWMLWFVLGRVPVYEVTDAARLEVQSQAHPIAAVVGGRVVRDHLRLDRPVRAGDVLVELDAESERLLLQEGRARLADQAARLTALRAEVALEQSGLQAHRNAREAAAREATARAREAQVRAEVAEAEARRVEQLSRSGGVAEVDRERANAEAQAQRATAQALQLGIARLERDGLLQQSDRRTRLSEMQRRVVELEGQLAVERSRAQRLEHQLEQRTIRAPIDGRIGQANELGVGAVVRVGDVLGSVVPAGEVRASALFPAAALGRIREGQPARIRLAGYPWAEYGTLPARVLDVGREPREGHFRVELGLLRDPSSAIPVEHGLPGAAEVEVERVSPLALVLRAAGRAVSSARAAPSAGDRP